MEKTTEFKQKDIEPTNYRLGMILGYTGIPPKLPLYGETWSQSIGIGSAQSERGDFDGFYVPAKGICLKKQVGIE